MEHKGNAPTAHALKKKRGLAVLFKYLISLLVLLKTLEESSPKWATVLQGISKMVAWDGGRDYYNFYLCFYVYLYLLLMQPFYFSFLFYNVHNIFVMI